MYCNSNPFISYLISPLTSDNVKSHYGDTSLNAVTRIHAMCGCVCCKLCILNSLLAWPWLWSIRRCRPSKVGFKPSFSLISLKQWKKESILYPKAEMLMFFVSCTSKFLTQVADSVRSQWHAWHEEILNWVGKSNRTSNTLIWLNWLNPLAMGICTVQCSNTSHNLQLHILPRLGHISSNSLVLTLSPTGASHESLPRPDWLT